jgi:hypothetical protein
MGREMRYQYQYRYRYVDEVERENKQCITLLLRIDNGRGQRGGLER